MYSDKESLYKALQRDAEHAGIIRDSLIRKCFYNIVQPNYCYRYIRLLREKDYLLSKNTIISRIYSKLIEVRLHRLGARLGFYIPKDVFGPGLYIPHSGSVTVNPNSRIGKNCQINNNVVIGQNKGKAPTIGDNVYIGPGAVISGDIIIADNVWIGANAVVTKSVTEPNVLVGGIPAKIISKREHNWVEEFSRL